MLQLFFFIKIDQIIAMLVILNVKDFPHLNQLLPFSLFILFDLLWH